MRIAILTPYFPPEMGAPPARLHETAVRLQRFGHQVTVVTAFPNRPLGKIYDGYRGKFRMVEAFDGLRVIRTWIQPAATASSFFLHRLINDLSFTWSSGYSSSRLVGKQDILIVQNPPLVSVFSAARLKKKAGAKLVMWCGDIWPDALLQAGRLTPGMMEKLMRRLQQYCFRCSDLLALTNPAIAREIQRKYKCPPITVWSNGVDTQLFSPEKRNENLRRGLGVGPNDLLVAYVGLHGRFQGLDAILDAAGILRDQEGLRFVFVGEGVEKSRLKTKARAMGFANVTFLDARSKEDIPELLASCDISVVPLVARMPGTMPSKFYEALASGTIPLVADGCEAAVLVRKYHAGVIYEPMDEMSVAKALMDLIEMKDDARDLIRLNARTLSLRFDRDRLATFVEKTLHAMVTSKEIPIFDW